LVGLLALLFSKSSEVGKGHYSPNNCALIVTNFQCKLQAEFVDDNIAPFIALIFFPGPNQVETFLTEHGGPGIQHIGLHTSNIADAVATLKDNGVAFIDPPSAYYSEVWYN